MHTLATVTLVCEHIIPGATEARAYRFVDTIFEAAEPLARTRLRDAIVLLDETARKGGGSSFCEAAAEAQVAILQNLAKEGERLESTQKIEDAKTTWLSRWSTAAPSATTPETLGPEFLQITRMLAIYGSSGGDGRGDVLDGASFSSSGNQNPTLTIMALAARAGTYIAGELQRRNL
jgi:hypothetical protein